MISFPITALDLDAGTTGGSLTALVVVSPSVYTVILEGTTSDGIVFMSVTNETTTDLIGNPSQPETMTFIVGSLSSHFAFFNSN